VKVLILGGGVFLGKHLIEALVARGHDVTTFTRGRNPMGAQPVTSLFGDRDGELTNVPRDGWHAVIDTCGFVPRIVRASAEHFRSAGRYAFVSSISVYDASRPSMHEDDTLPPLPAGTDPDGETVDGETYGPLKARCEGVVRDVFADRSLVVRPGLIVGPHDPTDRFTYWPERTARGGTILAPAPPDRYVQFVDVRDLAAFVVAALEAGQSGTVNATGAPQTTTMGDVVASARAAAGVPSEVCWVEDAFLERNGVEPWSELPLWIPDSLGLIGFSNADVSRALAWGLKYRSLDATTADTLAWAKSLPADRTRKAGLSPERESTLLETLGTAAG
jgi:2'-hydroxyisoflavone reductase